MSIRDWPEAERPREKLLAQGAGSLTDAELLSVLFRSGCSGASALDISRRLLRECGGLRALFTAEREALEAVHGVGAARFAQLQTVTELARRTLAESMAVRDVAANPAVVSQYLRLRIGSLPHEVFHVMYLNSRHHILACEDLFRGTLAQTQVYPRDIVKRALAANAAAVIVAHNHPSGNPEPSPDDVRITDRIKAALALVDIRLLDHLVITDTSATSLAERGLV
jgi:DNA repair protein RadC